MRCMIDITFAVKWPGDAYVPYDMGLQIKRCSNVVEYAIKLIVSGYDGASIGSACITRSTT